MNRGSREEETLEEKGNQAQVHTDAQDSETGLDIEAAAGGTTDAVVDELAGVRERLAQAEQLLADRDKEIATFRETEVELRTSLTRAVAGYRSLVLRTSPGIVAGLIAGETIEAIDESLSRARMLVDKVKQEVEARISSTRVPGGAPERTAPDLSVLSPREKIQYAVGRRS